MEERKGKTPRRLGESDLVYYGRLFFGRRWFLLSSALVGVVLAAVYTMRQPRLYQAQATVEFKQALPPGKDLDMVDREVFVPPALAVRLLTTKVLAARVINKLKERNEFWFHETPPRAEEPSFFRKVGGALRGILRKAWEGARVAVGGPVDRPSGASGDEPPPVWEGVDLGTIRRYYGHVSIRPVSMTSLVDIVVTHPDPAIAAKLADLHAQTFVEMDLETKVHSLSDAQSLVRQQLEDVKEKLEASRKALSDFQREHGILSLPDNATTVTHRSLQQLNDLLIQAQGERIVAEANYRNALEKTPEELVHSLPDPALRDLRQQLLKLEAQYRARLADYGPRHPDMLKLRAELEAMEARLRAAGEQARESLKAAYEAARAREEQLRASFEALSENASAEDRELVQFLILQRDVETNQELYEELLQQAKEADLTSGVFAWTNVKLVDRAVVPTVPAYPRPRRNLALGLLFGLLAGAFLCVFVERLDTRIYTPEEVTATLDLPSYGVIPDFHKIEARRPYGRLLPGRDGGGSESRELVTLVEPASTVAEAYRSVRTNLLFSTPGRPPRTILVTSSQAGEGKTVTVINLAVSLALSGSRVLVLDADLRNPGCHRPMRVSRTPGLSNVLTGQCSLEDVLVATPVLNGNARSNGHGLFVLPAGEAAPNPAELLGSEVMSELLAELKERFDFVLVDSPPVLPVTDSVVVATKTDGVLFVVRSGEWGSDVIQKAIAQLAAVRAHLLGVVLNCVDFTRGGYSYSYYRHYYRTYYGYGRKEVDERHGEVSPAREDGGGSV